MENYTKINILGSGSFGCAWLVQNKKDEECVLKEISIPTMKLKEKEAAINEVKILSTLKHKNIVRYKEAFINKNNLCICMEYADDGDLSTKIKQQNSRLFFELKIIDWFVQILIAVKYIHRLNILHRDLKSQNIFLTASGLIKIGDFGISRFLDGGLQQAQTAIGTPYYLSPEICQHKPYNNKTDMWSLGVLLYELSTLRHPFLADDFSTLVVKIIKGKYKPISNCYGPLLHDLVLVLLQVNACERPSAAQLLKVPSLQEHIKHYLMKVKHKQEPIVVDSGICLSSDDEKVRKNLNSPHADHNSKNKFKAPKPHTNEQSISNSDGNDKYDNMPNQQDVSYSSCSSTCDSSENIMAHARMEGVVCSPMNHGSVDVKVVITTDDQLKCEAKKTSTQKKAPKVNFIERNRNLAGTPPTARSTARSRRIQSTPETRQHGNETPKIQYCLRSRTKSTDSSKLPLLATRVKQLSVKQLCRVSENPRQTRQTIINHLKPPSNFVDPDVHFPNVRKRAASFVNLAAKNENIPCKITKRSVSCEDKSRMMGNYVPKIVVDDDNNFNKGGNPEDLPKQKQIPKRRLSDNLNQCPNTGPNKSFKPLPVVIRRSRTDLDQASVRKNYYTEQNKKRRSSVDLLQGSRVPENVKSKIAGRLRAASCNINAEDESKSHNDINFSDKSVMDISAPLHSTLKDDVDVVGLTDILPSRIEVNAESGISSNRMKIKTNYEQLQELKTHELNLKEKKLPKLVKNKHTSTYTVIRIPHRGTSTNLYSHLSNALGVKKFTETLELASKIKLSEKDYEILKCISDALGADHREYLPYLFEVLQTNAHTVEK